MPICSVGIEYNLRGRETSVLVFGRGLWFGSRMERSLINIKQCRYYGISVCDNPMDGHQSLGIETEEGFISMGMKGTTFTFTTWCPTDDGYQQCHQILLSDKGNWDPYANIFHISYIWRRVEGVVLVRRQPLHDILILSV